MNKDKLLKQAFNLALFTIVYNLVEGTVSVLFGLQDETLALFGFGVDSFVEVISGVGILHMVLRMKKNDVKEHDAFERTALKITGFAFYVLSAGLVVGSALNLYYGIAPETTVVGVIVSSLSILTMYFLMTAKMKVGKALDMDAIIADANCTKTCYYLSFILLAASGLYLIFGIKYFDILGSLGIAYFAFSEGREAFEKAKTGSVACACGNHCETEVAEA